MARSMGGVWKSLTEPGYTHVHIYLPNTYYMLTHTVEIFPSHFLVFVETDRTLSKKHTRKLIGTINLCISRYIHVTHLIVSTFHTVPLQFMTDCDA